MENNMENNMNIRTIASKYGPHKHVRKVRVCVACKNSRICQTCMGNRCQACDYTGVCLECIDWAPANEDEWESEV